MCKYTKKEKFIKSIKHQLNVELKNEDSIFNYKKNILYTKINKINKYVLFSYFNKNNIKYEEHLNNKFWVYL